ncbi:hypothetical protein ACMD2_17873 [Ananas comosus]|uniref:DUF8040 domain-containing protein n=1 Tax=Ananas comosus TaxID=4615 RepID=A0A199ULD6_ANACO|nr:hypothetical protein ACMD2_17873 [Ananas comosus]
MFKKFLKATMNDAREFRMETHVFKALVKCLEDKGLILDTKYVSAEEQLAIGKECVPLRPSQVRPWPAVATVAEKSAAPLWTAAATVAKMSAVPLRTAAATVAEMSAAPLRTAAATVAEMSTAPLRTATTTVAEMSAADEVSVAASAAVEVSAAASAAAEVSAAKERVGCGEGGD